MQQSVFRIIVASALAILTADALYDQFLNKRPQVVFVRGGDMSVTVDGGNLDSVGSINDLDSKTFDVKVTGGTLDYPTDISGNLIVKPAAR